MKIVMIGPIPEPFTGQSVSFKKLKDSLSLDESLEVFHVDTSPSASSHITGSFKVHRLFETLRIILVYFYFILFKRPDVIYLTKGSTVLGFSRDFIFVLLKVFFNGKARFVVHLKGGNYDEFYYSCSIFFRYLIRFFLDRVDRIIVLGKSLTKMYDFHVVLSEKIVVIENALTFDLESDVLFERKKDVSFIYLSNLILSKGFLDVAEAGEKLNKEGVVGFQLEFAGEFMLSPDDPYDVYLKRDRFFEIIRDNSNIKYLGTVSGQEKSRLLRSASVLILPTKYHVEGQPNCIIEAMAYSCAIISTNYRSIPDLVDESNSFFVEYGRPEQISEKMALFVHEKEILARMGGCSKRIYDERLSWDVHYNKIYKVLFE